MKMKAAAYALPLAIALTVAALPTAARAATPTAQLDRATRCLRLADAACALDAADRALAALPGDDSGGLRREALAVRAQALALTDHPDDARAAFAALRAAWPGWRPAPDAEQRATDAWTAARRDAVATALPTVLDPGPLPPPPPVPDDATLPAPVLYAPAELVALAESPAAPPRLHLSLGAGVGLLGGAAADRYSPGVHAALDFTVDLGDDGLGLWFQAVLALLPLAPDLPVEPGAGGGLTVFSVAAGGAYALPLVDDLALVAAIGVGFGSLGRGRLGDADGLALHGSLGLRWQADERLAVRLDGAPLLILAPDIAPAGHVAILIRGETRF